MFPVFLVFLFCPAFSKKFAFDSNSLDESENNLLQATCGKPPPSSNSSFASLYGHRFPKGETPWVVSLTVARKWHPEMEEHKIRDDLYFFCSGVLISSRHVLTAAHCIGVVEADCAKKVPRVLQFRNLDRWRVFMGGSCTSPAECQRQHSNDQLVAARVAKAFFPSYYTSDICPDNDAYGDMAVLELQDDVIFSKNLYPACFSSKKAVDNDVVLVTGFGTDPGQDLSVMPEFAVLKVIAERVTECPISYAPDTFCTASKYTSACSGDSGGGIISLSQSGVATVVGVVSRGEECKIINRNHERDSEVWTGSLQTDAWHHAPWICLTTGICSEKTVIEDLVSYMALPAKSRPWLAYEVGPVPYEEIFI